ncbi:MAG: NAD-dependent epimerase/dehydratase family protein [Klebsiella quasipneumoniae]|nr:NAD-dependent epimerase/dehydratase family protein [Klebsiella quasipneumoniae]
MESKKTQVLVTGANGYIGNALVNFLLGRSEFEVRVAARRGSVLNCPKVHAFTIGNLEDEPDLIRPLAGCDVVYHCATLAGSNSPHLHEFSLLQKVNVQGTANLARQAANAGVKRFVFVSTIQVDGETTPPGKKFFADSLPRPKLAVGMSMLRAEQELKEISRHTGMEIVIVRTPIVYGPECRNIFRLAQEIVRYCCPLPLRSTYGNMRSLVGIDNLTSFLFCVATHPKAANETFLVSDGQHMSTLQIFKLLAETCGRPCLLWAFPTKLLSLFNSYIGRRSWGEFLFENLVVDIGKNKALLGWKPPFSVEDQFTRSWKKRKVLGAEAVSK